jgi:hypothetical protein
MRREKKKVKNFVAAGVSSDTGGVECHFVGISSQTSTVLDRNKIPTE